MGVSDPLTDDDLAQMKIGVEKLDEADAQIRKAQSAGIDIGGNSQTQN